MLAVLGPRLQRLAIRAWDRKPDSQDSLVPAVLELCPLLNRLEVSDTWPGCVGLVRFKMSNELTSSMFGIVSRSAKVRQLWL